MYSPYQDREELEDDLYQDNKEDSDGSEVNSELEFHLYSQLHYSSNAGNIEEQVDGGEETEGQELELTKKTTDDDKEQEQTGESWPSSPDLSKIQQYLKKKGEARDKPKKGKIIPKAQKASSSSVFEEVIVIDSSPNIISISDDDDDDNDNDDEDDDDDGVCASKGVSSKGLQTSTPAQQGSQNRKRSLAEPVVVDLSSSESDSSDSSKSSDSSDSSDSDGLENWMMLGPEKQEGDQSISLNLEGGSDSSADVDVDEDAESTWVVSDKDKEAQIYNKDKGARIGTPRLPNRYYTNKSVQCRNCNKCGHLSKNCPEPKKLSSCFLCGTPGHLVSYCPNRHCSNCGLPGHLYESCTERAYWQKQCHRCNMTGHFYDACPEIWRQYHITTKTGIPAKHQGKDQGRSPAYCYNCSKRGHFGHTCTRQRMFNGTYPTTPFINHYDTREDINRRKHRMKLKVNDLKQNGLLPAHPQTPVTPGPPKKKPKLSHHKNNHDSYHQSPNNHKPSPSHIFFSDNHDFDAQTHKRNKFNKHQHKLPQSTGSVKPWKPKRPVPTSRDPPAKVIVDEAADFPRGNGKIENMEMEQKGKKKKKTKQIPSVPPEGHKKSKRAHEGSGSKPGKAKSHWKKIQRLKAEKQTATHMYPKDENLFVIKQRKRSRQRQ